MSGYLFVTNAAGRRRTLALYLMVSAASMSWNAARADIYRWVSDDGVTEYSEHRPNIDTPVETIVHTREAPPATPEAGRDEAETPPAAPPPPPQLCDGDIGSTAVGTLAMMLNRAYIASIPEFVADNAETFASEDFYLCLDAVLETAPQHEQITGGDDGTADPDAPLAVMLESAGTLPDALRALNEGNSGEWQKIFAYMNARRPRLDADIGTLTRLIRSVVVAAQANARQAALPPGAR